MSRELLRKAIEEPVILSKCFFETSLVDIVLDDLGDEPGNLPLLQHALHLLWNKRDADKLTFNSYKEIGKVKGAIAMLAENIYQNLTSQQKESCKKIFLRLTSLEANQSCSAKVHLKRANTSRGYYQGHFTNYRTTFR